MNQLTILDRIDRKAMTRALKDFVPLEEEYKRLGVTLDDLYERAVASEFNALERALKLKPKLDELLTKYNITTQKPAKLSKNLFWITLRPSDEHSHRFAEFKTIVTNNYLTRSCFNSYKYAWEQKGETPDTMGKGYHIHILAQCPNYLMKTQLIKDTKSTFKKFCNGDVPEAFIQVEYVRTYEHLNNIRAYMSGIKSDEWKEPACELDKPWRKKYNLDDLYGDLEFEECQ